jgi:hypothetical protein
MASFYRVFSRSSCSLCNMAEEEKEEDWEKELLVPAPGRLVYMGQGQVHYVYLHQGTPDPLWPKKKKKKKKKKAAPEPVPPEPAPEPKEDWDAEIAASQLKEDWDAEIAASQ